MRNHAPLKKDSNHKLDSIHKRARWIPIAGVFFYTFGKKCVRIRLNIRGVKGLLNIQRIMPYTNRKF